MLKLVRAGSTYLLVAAALLRNVALSTLSLENFGTLGRIAGWCLCKACHSLGLQ